jgi:hypothetical protein
MDEEGVLEGALRGDRFEEGDMYGDDLGESITSESPVLCCFSKLYQNG